MKQILIFPLMSALLFSVSSQAFETKATNALLLDADTGTVLFEKDADIPMPPASMSKLMTVYVLFEALKNGRLSMEDEFVVSENAWRIGGAASGGSTMFLNPGEKVKIKDLLRGIIIQSGNDACITVAENLAGSETAFAEILNEKAKELGLTGSSFKNATGLPDPQHRMTARDLAKLAQVLIQKFPEYYSIFSEKEFTYNGIKQDNRNPLLYRVGGADGLKTGHTIESGYGLTGALKTTDGRRLVVIVNGLKTIRERDSESAKLATYGMAGFKVTTLISADKIVEKIPVWLGAEDSVEVITEKEVKVTLPLSKKEPKVTIVYDTPVKAPIKKGDVLAHLIIKDENINEKVNLLAVKDIEKAGYFKRVKQIISSWF